MSTPERARVGDHELIEVLGRGAAGTVYRARAADGREVALKLLASADGQRRFDREVEALRALRHPGIVSLLAAGSFQGRPFLVTELVTGESLQARLDRGGPLGTRAAAALARGLASALAYAHERGVLHRDVKPGNVLMGTDGSARLLDFGLARGLDASSLTRTGQLLGTPGFWSPEQARGERALGPATDVYGLGATLYAALTGSPPFVAASLTELLVITQTRRPEPPSRLRPDVDPALDALCVRCLDVDPARRPTIPELERALDQVVSAPRRRRRPRRGRRFVAAALVVVAAALVAAKVGPGPGAPPTPIVAPPAPPSPRARTDEALALLRRAVPLAGRGEEGVDAAVALAAEATALAPRSGRVLFVRAWILRQAAAAGGAALDDAARELAAAEAAGHPPAEVAAARAALLAYQDALVRHEAATREAARPAASADDWLQLGLTANALGRFSEGVAAMRRVQEARPEDWSAAYHVGMTEARRGEPARAAEPFERGLALATRAELANPVRLLRIMLAEVRLELEQPAEAERLMSAALQVPGVSTGEQGILQQLHARALLALGRHAAAVDAATRALQLLDRAIQERPDDGLAIFGPRRVVPHADRGRALLALGRAEEGKAALRDALDLAASLTLDEHAVKEHAFTTAHEALRSDDPLLARADAAFP